MFLERIQKPFFLKFELILKIVKTPSMKYLLTPKKTEQARNPILGWLVVTLVHDGLVAAARVLEGGPAGLAGGVGPVEKSKEPDPEGHEHDMEDRHLEALLPVDRRDEVGPQGRLAV